MNRLPALSLAGLELRRFLRGRLTAAALVVLAVIPLLYGALYLYAFWDPYGRLNHIPAALVMQDRPAKAMDDSTVHAGKALADELISREVFDWHVTDESDARRGLENGRYHFVLHIPADFSAALVTGPDPSREPRAAQLRMVSDDATNYLSGQFSRTAFAEVRAAAAADASTNYFDKMLVGFTDLKQETRKAANGADELRGGASDATDGANRLSGGLNDASSGADDLAGGLNSAARGADKLAGGLVAIRSGADRLATSTAQAAAVGRQLAGVVDTAADRAGPILRDNAALIEQSATQIANGADALADSVGALTGLADTAVTNAEQVRDRLSALVAARPELADDPAVVAARLAADRAVTGAKQLRAELNTLDLDALRKDLREAAATARKVAKAAPHLADDLAAARSQVDRFADGLNQIAAGAGRLRTGTADASSGATDLRGGIFRLRSGALALDGGLTTLSAGGHRLAAGLDDLEGGAAQLATGLADGAEKVPGYGDDPSARAGVLGEPVTLDRSVRHPAATYGVAFAPYFLALALWVGAMITFMVLRPMNRRHIMSGAPAHRVALAGLLPAVAVGLTQALVLFSVVTFGLGLSAVNPWATLGLLMLSATVFASIIQLLGAALGAIGRIVALALLMLQLTSAGGTYPVQTTPEFFQFMHPLLPMTYMVEALRHTIDGGPTGTVTAGALALLGFGTVSLALTIATARRSRRLTPSKLHPQLVI